MMIPETCLRCVHCNVLVTSAYPAYQSLSMICYYPSRGCAPWTSAAIEQLSLLNTQLRRHESPNHPRIASRRIRGRTGFTSATKCFNDLIIICGEPRIPVHARTGSFTICELSFMVGLAFLSQTHRQHQDIP